ncbi:adenine glycosylase [Photobacterium sp. CAU 1568]|uniref:Adenine glycosylase n=1 Tax=Photobacterium arenosum TaxID=2774143 RepID=A0ABR9BRG0_9GAMM|nr:adenine glycosylase [Photobacterium arenosum]MBD8515160.1 adenine glycosylase [Photobacterium arenosum]
MLTLSGTQLSLKSLRVSVRQQLAGQDMSGQTAATDQAETGDKAKVLSVSGTIPFERQPDLSKLFELAGVKENDARQVYRISNRTAQALKIREVKFQGNIRGDEQESLRQWAVSFELVEHRSVPERVESREADKAASQQTVQGVETPSDQVTASADVPPETTVELTGFMGVLKRVDNALA